MLYDCLIKTQHSAKIINLSIECDVCPVPALVNRLIKLILVGLILTETPVKGGLNVRVLR
jgi:hypothetical protein